MVLKSIKENEPRATSLGYRTDDYKLLAFILSATLALDPGGFTNAPIDTLQARLDDLAAGVEHPRLDRFMAAPPRLPDAKAANRIHVTYPAEAGNVILFESWLRHEVATNRVAEERISISFNLNWS
jgi:hypothetical protein